MISAAIVGGSGYTGKYIIKFLNQHSQIKNINIFANRSAGKTVHEIFPEFLSEIENKEIISISDLDYNHDIYFFALPHGESEKYIPSLIDKGKTVIDLGADYRLDDPEEYLSTYKLEHASPQLLKSKLYGLADYLGNSLSAKLVANPGCYPTAALLSSIPLVRNLDNIIINASTVAYSGISGAGKKASVDLIFAENYNSVKAYNVGTHRHEVEIIQELKKYSEKIDYSLTTHLLPIFSGIYSTTVFFLKEKVYQDEVDQMFMNEYLGKEFIRIRENPPELKWVINTNYCDLNVKVVNNKVFVTAAIDNLIKGASGQAVQNMNKIFGWEESLGIKTKKEELQDV